MAAAESLANLTIDGDGFPANLRRNLSILSPQQVELAKMLIELEQSHMFEQWPEPGVEDDEKRAFFDQVISFYVLLSLVN